MSDAPKQPQFKTSLDSEKGSPVVVRRASGQSTAVAEQATDLVGITVDGKQMQVPKGELLIKAAEDQGVYIPRFCWHPRLRTVAMCRMCLVDIEGLGLKPACWHEVSDGMKVETKTPEVEKAQEGVLEFLLINHPLDCPVCDRGGECPLQDHTMSFGPGESRFVEAKRHFEKPIPVSDLVLLDRERCIQCARCTRFAAEVAGDPLLEFSHRGNDLHIVTYPNAPFSSYFSGNVVQICPVGALTATPYRFKARPWDVTAAETTCTMCSVGCRGVLYETRDVPIRLNGVDTESVNWGWLCDKGRFGYEYVASDERLTTPLRQPREGKHVAAEEVTWAQAVEMICAKLHQDVKVAAIGGARLTNEEAYVVSKFMRVVCGSNDVDCQLDDGLPAAFVAGAQNRATIGDLESAAAIVLACPDLKDELPILYLRVRDAADNHDVPLLIAGGMQSGLDQFAKKRTVTADVVTATDLPTEGNVVLIVGRQSLTQDPAQLCLWALELAAQLGDRVKLMPVLRRSNAHGALDMGLSPELLPGRVSVDDPENRGQLAKVWTGKVPTVPGRDTRGILEAAARGDIDVLFLVGSDPIADFPDPDLARAAFEKCDFVVALDLFATRSTDLADLVIPCAGWGEVDGTVTNIEGRVQRVVAKVVAPGQASSDADLFREVAFGLGIEFGCQSPESTLFEISQVAPAYNDILGADGRFPGAGQGTRARKAGREGVLVHEAQGRIVNGLKPDLFAAQYRSDQTRQPALERVSPASGRFALQVSRSLYDRGSLVGHCPSLADLRPGPVIRIHPEDLARRGFEVGEIVSASGENWEHEFTIEARRSVVPGTAVIPHAQVESVKLLPEMIVNVKRAKKVN